ncbi:exodeoxyribonuclease VII large subunit [uncultured Methylibium sp.]|uniref:exodeoxyribonuclease VII large subunit n=1 Tax=uncultured Methylibium sp. TaxID=381093 RepID=UPI0025D19F62|nr:exodeoxyribonuclease VII large subunit [uncultured Methylibium sp.]
MSDAEAMRAGGSGGPRVWEVAGLVNAVADALAARFGAVAVRGEVAGFTRAASGHCYFTLKDATGSAALRCAMFRRAAGLLAFAPGEGDLVELRGRLAVYEPRGELQFIVESMQRAGAGALYERFLRLKAQLEAEGLFDADRKRAIVRQPRCVGVVTSLAGAALHDVLTALQRRAPQVRVIVYPSPVQGADAPSALAQAIEVAGRHAQADTLLLCRGGGSLEDLWAFNEAVVVRAVAASTIAVIAGIGHETDVTLVDFAADLRAPTPTAAAELAAASREDLLKGLAQLAGAMRARVERSLQSQAQRLDRLGLGLGRPAERLMRQRSRIESLAQRLAHGARASVRLGRTSEQRAGLALAHAVRLRRERLGHALQTLQTRLEALDPARVVGRGYALVETEQGDLVVEPGQLQPGQDLRLTLARGRAALRIDRLLPE